MKPPPPRDLIDVLRLTLEQVEKSESLNPDDKSLRELKSSIARTLAELELSKARKSA
jgi:hypothetical protein